MQQSSPSGVTPDYTFTVNDEPITLKFPENVDSTQLSLWSSCPQKWFIEFCLGRRQGGKNIHLHAGGAFAEGMEWVRRYHFEGYDKEEALRAAFLKYAKFWGEYPLLLDENKSFVNMWMAIEAYLERWPLDGKDELYHILTNDNGDPWVEFSFAIPVPVNHPISGDPLLYSGRCDALVSEPRSDMIFPLDDKTTQSMGPSWTKSWAMRGQLYGYTWATRQMGWKSQGAIVRGVSLLKKSFDTQEVPVFLSEAQVNEWYYHSVIKLQQMADTYSRVVEFMQTSTISKNEHDYFLNHIHHLFPKSFADGCTNYGGCAFQDLCSSRQPWELYSDYDVFRWNPLAKDPAEESEDRLLEVASMKGDPDLLEFMTSKGLGK